MSKKGNFLLGAGVGLGLGFLFAPKSGKETRKDLAKLFDELIEKAKDIDVEEVKNAIIVKETAKQLIIDKSNEVKIKAQELVELAKEKATPVVEKTAKEVKNKTAEVLKAAANKLEEKPQPVKKAKN